MGPPMAAEVLAVQPEPLCRHGRSADRPGPRRSRYLGHRQSAGLCHPQDRPRYVRQQQRLLHRLRHAVRRRRHRPGPRSDRRRIKHPLYSLCDRCRIHRRPVSSLPASSAAAASSSGLAANPAVITVAKYEYPAVCLFCSATRKANQTKLIQWGADDVNATAVGVAGSKTRVIRVFPPGKTNRKCQPYRTASRNWPPFSRKNLPDGRQR